MWHKCILLCLTAENFTRQWEKCLGLLVLINNLQFTANPTEPSVTLMYFTLSNARRFYSSVGRCLGLLGLTNSVQTAFWNISIILHPPGTIHGLTHLEATNFFKLKVKASTIILSFSVSHRNISLIILLISSVSDKPQLRKVWLTIVKFSAVEILEATNMPQKVTRLSAHLFANYFALYAHSWL